jgi:hypothetical protein
MQEAGVHLLNHITNPKTQPEAGILPSIILIIWVIAHIEDDLCKY